MIQLFPLLLSSLSSTDGDLKIGTLDTLDLILQEAPAVAMEHAGSIIDLLLVIVTSRDPAHGNGVVCSCQDLLCFKPPLNHMLSGLF